MKLQKVIIDNFRNINHAEYDLEKVNIFAGPNGLGKTNTILAIYWCLLDYLLDGSSDFMSIKPQADTKKEVSVEVEFDDGFKFKKTYAEKWVKTRGSDEVTMSGHETTIYINDAKASLTEAKKTLREKLIGDFDREYTTTGFDFLRALMDPYYMGLTCEWKELRKFIIALIGDVSNDDVLHSNQSLISIKDRLAIDNYDTAKTSKYFKQQISRCKESINDYESQIKGLDTIKDVSAEAIQEAKEAAEKIDQMIADAKAGNSRQAILSDLEGALSSKRIQLSKAMQEDLVTLKNLNIGIQLQIDPLLKELSELENELQKEKSNNETLLKQQSDYLFKKLNTQNQIEVYESEVQRLREEYQRNAEAGFNSGNFVLPDVSSCPACGYVINSEAIDSIKSQIEENRMRFELEKKEQLATIKSMGNEKKASIQNVKISLNEIATVLDSLKNQLFSSNSKIETLGQKISKKKFDIEVLEKQKKHEFTSPRTAALNIEVDKLISQLEQEKANSANDDVNKVVSDLKAKKDVHNQILAEHSSYITAQEQIKKIEIQSNNAADNLIGFEQNLMLVESFIQTKLSLFKDRISSVFGDKVTFTLIKQNLKEDSWDEVCYPSVLNKPTSFVKGSGSEQILTGIYLAECVRNKLGLQELPYIFDECDKLDTNSLASIDTNCQIISTKVDDVNYKKVTLTTA